MSKSLKGTQTEKNLLAAFAGESQARNRYTFFSKQAEKEGYIQISNIFKETASQEEQHAKTFFKFLEGGMVEMTAAYPAGMIEDTLTNLRLAADGENEEWSKLYPYFSEIAEKEGFLKIAARFKIIASVEREHESRYRKLYENIKGNVVFQKNEKAQWLCSKCGYVHYGEKAPQICPSCEHPQGYFEIKSDNY
jgi:rubrerythrin